MVMAQAATAVALDALPQAKGLSKGYKQTEIGLIPDEWQVGYIEEIATITTGGRNTQDRIDDGQYPFFVRSQNVERIDTYSFDGEAVLTAGDGVGTGKIFHYINGKCDIHQRVYRISDFAKGINGYYFFLYFSANFYDRIMQMTAKSSVDSVRREMIARMPIAIPPKPEQDAIASAVLHTEQLIESLESIVAKKRAIKQGAMQELLTGQNRLPGFNGEWPVRQLRDVCIKIQDGTHFSPELGGRDFLYVTSKNIGRGVLDLSSVETISAEEHAKIYSRCDARRGDLLLTKDGANTGNAAINCIDEPISLLSSVAMLRFDPKAHCAEFFLYSLLSASGQNLIKNLMSGNAITRLTLEKIRGLAFGVPGIEEQRSIATVLVALDKELRLLEEKLSKARQIKQGMVQELLTGRVRLA